MGRGGGPRRGQPLIRRVLPPTFGAVAAAIGAALGAAIGAWYGHWAVAAGVAAGFAAVGGALGVVAGALTPDAADPLRAAMARARVGEPPDGDDPDIRFLRGMVDALREQVRSQAAAARRDAAQQRLAAHEADAAARATRAAQTAFLGRMSHELRTPLNAVIGYSELVAEVVTDPEAAADLTRVRRAGLHLQGLVTTILDLAQLESGRHDVRPEPIDLQRLVDETVEGARNEAETNLNRIDVEVSAPAAPVADRRMLASILFNLVHNAVKFTARGTVTIRATVTDDRLTLVVADSGIGMTAQQLAEASRPFSQADDSRSRRYDGSGLGLAIVRGFAEAMGGNLTIDSAIGRGSTVTVTLPRVVEPRLAPDDDREEQTQLLR